MAQVVTLGELLLRLSAPGATRLVQSNVLDVSFGGSEANVAAALSQWGVSTKYVSQFADNVIGDAAVQALLRFGIDVSNIKKSKHRMGIYFLEHGNSLRAPHVVYDRFDSAFANIESSSFNWDEILQDAEWFHWSGITPAISASAANACREAIAVARKKNIVVSGDINYRRVLWQYGKTPLDVMPELIAQCDVVIGGLVDFENSLNIKASGKHAFEKVCTEVQKKYPQVKQIAKTLRLTADASHNELQGFLWNGEKIVSSKTYRLLPIADRIGSGDAFMAGFIYKCLQREKNQQVIEFATCAAAYKHTMQGDVLQAKAKEVEMITRNESIGKLLR
ncbi:MAG: PfkB family carbohydrate kinase [Bacteroidota bacterium]